MTKEMIAEDLLGYTVEQSIERCRCLYNTGILFDGNTKNPFKQSVFIEIVINLRHIQAYFKHDGRIDSIKGIRDITAHPKDIHKLQIGTTGIYVDFGQNFQGNWKFNPETHIAIRSDETCDILFSYGENQISAKEIGKRICEYEALFAELKK